MLKSIPFYASLLEKKLINQIKVNNSHILVYGAIEVHSWGHLGCIASNETIGRETGLTKNTVAKCLSQISQSGWVKVALENGKRTSIIPLLTIQDPLPIGKPPFTQEKTPLYSGVNIDNILDNSKIKTANDSKESLKFSPQGADIIKEMESIDPKNKRYYNNKSQREACEFLIKEYSYEKVIELIRWLPKLKENIPYMPSVTTPCELRDRWQKIIDAVQRARVSKKNKIKENLANVVW